MQQPAGVSEIRIDQGSTSEHLRELRADPILPRGTCSLIRSSQFTKETKGEVVIASCQSSVLSPPRIVHDWDENSEVSSEIRDRI
jgi:hypothetical protein